MWKSKWEQENVAIILISVIIVYAIVVEAYHILQSQYKIIEGGTRIGKSLITINLLVNMLNK